MASLSLLYFSFNLQEQWSTNEIVERIFNVEFKEDENRFVLHDYDEKIIDGIFIMYYVAKEWKYNIQSKIVESVDIQKTNVIAFTIDIEQRILEIWSNKSNAQKVIVALGLSLDNKVIIDTIQITIPNTIDKLLKNAVVFGKIKIENFLLENNLVASCIFDLSNYESPKLILERYKKDIVQLSVGFRNYEDIASVTFYSTGSVVLYKSKESLHPELLEKIKSICLS